MNRAFFLVGILMIAGVFAGGCGLNTKGDREVAAFLTDQEQGRSKQADLYGTVPRVSQPSTAPATCPSGPVAAEPEDLRDYLQRALAENPEIQSARQNALAKAKRIPQVTALPDPMLGTRTFTPNRPMMLNEGNNVFSLTISQQLPNPEKLDRAGRMALEETRMALAELEQVQRRVIADVKRAYFQIYLLGKSAEITRVNQQLLRELITVARTQVAAGRRSQDDVLRAQVEYSNLDRELIELRQQRTAATATLNALMNRRPDHPAGLPKEFDVRRIDLKLDGLLDRADRANPELRRLAHQIERDRESLRLAKLGYWPDFRIGLEWMAMEPRSMPPDRPTMAMSRQPNGAMMPMMMMPMGNRRMGGSPKDMYAIMAEVNLPVWVQKIDAGIREAEYNLGSSIDQYHAARNLVAFRIQDALSRVRAQRELVLILRDMIIPQARQAYELTRTSYMAGTSDFTGLIDSWQNWLKFTIQYHRALGELERSVADLEQEIGTSLVEAERPAPAR